MSLRIFSSSVIPVKRVYNLVSDSEYLERAAIVQSDINDKMRAILVDWLVEVHLKFKVCAQPIPCSLHNDPSLGVTSAAAQRAVPAC